MGDKITDIRPRYEYFPSTHESELDTNDDNQQACQDADENSYEF